MEALLYATADVLNTLISALIFAIFARAILSWMKPDPKHRMVTAFNQITDPILVPIRNKIPTAYSIDFSPIIAIMILMLLKRYLIGAILTQMGQ